MIKNSYWKFKYLTAHTDIKLGNKKIYYFCEYTLSLSLYYTYLSKTLLLHPFSAMNFKTSNQGYKDSYSTSFFLTNQRLI